MTLDELVWEILFLRASIAMQEAVTPGEKEFEKNALERLRNCELELKEIVKERYMHVRDYDEPLRVIGALYKLQGVEWIEQKS